MKMTGPFRFLPGCGFALAFLLGLGASQASETPPTPTPPTADDAQSPDSEPDGILNSASLRPLPQGAAFTVKAWDNSAENVELARYIEDQLRTRGIALGGADALMLKFSTSEALGQLSNGRQRQVIEFDARAGTAGENDAQVLLNLFSSDKGGVFNEGQPQTKVQSTQTLEMTIDRPDGQRLWQGEATAKLTNQDRRLVSQMLVGPLLDAVGKTARSQPFGIK